MNIESIVTDTTDDIWNKTNTSYLAFKLGRKADSYNRARPAVSNGKIFDGLDCVASNITFDGNSAKEEDQGPDGLIPKIGSCVALYASKFNSGNSFLRTSNIQDFYIHGNYEASKDKIILKPENADLLKGIDFQDGDILLNTMNSLYYLKAIKNNR
jgi:hypothetical protein